MICIQRDVDIFDKIHIVDDRDLDEQYSFHVMLILVLDDDDFVVFVSNIRDDNVVIDWWTSIGYKMS